MYNRRQFIEGMGAVGAANWASQSFAIAKRPPDLTKLSLALDQYFVPFERMRDFSGIIVVEKGTKQLIRSWGRADFASGRPHSLRTRYAAESISKMFTHAAVVALQSAGRLSMRDPLARFVPDFPRASDITIRQLVDHQAGISRDLSLVGADATRPHSTSEIVAMIARTQNGEPGKESYSNNGYRILARVVELAGGGAFDDLVRALVLQPHRMADTLFGANTRQPMARRATGYVPGPGWRTIRRAEAWDFSNSRGAASYYTSPADLMRFLRAVPLERGDVVNAEGAVESGRFGRITGHDGFGNGFANLAYSYPGEDTRLVLLGNIQSGLFMSLKKDMRALLAEQTIVPPTVDEAPELGPSQRWSDYVGTYDLRPGAPLIVRRSGEHLEVSAGEEFHPIVAVGPNRFFMRLRYAMMSFPAAPAPVDSIRWDEGGRGFTLKKLT